MEIICRRCAQPWMLEPRKWRTHRFVNNNGVTYRILRCPNCNAKNLVKLKDVIRVSREERRLAKKKHLVK